MAADRRRASHRAARGARGDAVPVARRSRRSGARPHARQPPDARRRLHAGIRPRADAHLSRLRFRSGRTRQGRRASGRHRSRAGPIDRGGSRPDSRRLPARSTGATGQCPPAIRSRHSDAAAGRMAAGTRSLARARIETGTAGTPGRSPDIHGRCRGCVRARVDRSQSRSSGRSTMARAISPWWRTRERRRAR